MGKIGNFIRSTKGNVAVVMAFAAPVLIGVAGLGTETGYYYFVEKRTQAVADVAAYAGAVVRAANGSDAETTSSIENEILNANVEITSLEANFPPKSGPNQNARAVEVILNTSVDRLLTSVFGTDPVTVSVRSVALFQEPTTACLLALNQSGSETLAFSGAVDVRLSGCELMSNSIATDAVRLRGSARVEADCLNTVGAVSQSGSGSQVILNECRAPREHVSRSTDPYEDVPFPGTMDPCFNLSANVNINLGVLNVSAGINGSRRFCNGLNISGDTVFEPGVYIIDGGTFRLNGNSSISGTGVTFALTGGADIRFNGDADINIVAPTTGPYAGLVIFGDPDDQSTDYLINGSATSMITGAIYAPRGSIDMRGNFSNPSGCLQLVADTIEISGSVDFSADCESAGIRRAEVPGKVSLVE